MKRYPVYMDSQQTNDFETRLIAALERCAEPAIPADFATRLAAQLPPLKPARRSLNAGRTISIVSAAVCVFALGWLVPHATPCYTSIAFDLELALFAQLAFIAHWLTSRREA